MCKVAGLLVYQADKNPGGSLVLNMRVSHYPLEQKAKSCTGHSKPLPSCILDASCKPYPKTAALAE